MITSNRIIIIIQYTTIYYITIQKKNIQVKLQTLTKNIKIINKRKKVFKMKKMKLNVINPSHEITTTYTNQRYIIAKLLGLLFNKTIADSRHIRRIKYNYNYSNTQNIAFIFDNDYKYEFINIPTSGGLLNDFEIEQLIKKESEVK